MREKIEKLHPSAVVDYREQSGSTMDLARQILIDHPERLGLVGIAVAEEQLAGRGRQGRTWVSRRGDGVYVSVAWRYERIPESLGLLPLCIGVHLLRQLPKEASLFLKWPNDLVTRERQKAGGVLVESSAVGDRLEVVSGVGLNLRGEPPPPGITLERLGINVSWQELVLLNIKAQTEACAESSFSSILEEYRASCILLGSEVELVEGENRFRGLATDIADDGALVISSDGRKRRVYSGDVHITGYGQTD